jgi:lysozyme
MAQLKVVVKRLNKRSSIPRDFSEANVVGVVQQGYLFEGAEAENVVNPSLGKWYKDANGYCYWAGGLAVLGPPLGTGLHLPGIPYNLPSPFRAGIDVSHHNVLPDWDALRLAGISFVYIKISEGVGTPDVKAKDLARQAAEYQLKTGYYHFCRPDRRNGGTVTLDATAEADDALGRMSAIGPSELPLVMDLEDQQQWDTPLEPKDYLSWVNTFMARIKDKTGRMPAIYSRKKYLDQKLPADHGLGVCKLWISRYGIRDARQLELPVGWYDWSLWQYCEDGVIGENSKLDINILKDPTLF